MADAAAEPVKNLNVHDHEPQILENNSGMNGEVLSSKLPPVASSLADKNEEKSTVSDKMSDIPQPNPGIVINGKGATCKVGATSDFDDCVEPELVALMEEAKKVLPQKRDGSDSGVEEDGSPRKASQDAGTPKKDINGAEPSNSTGEKSPGKKIPSKTLPVSKIAVAKSSSVTTKTAVSKTITVTSPDSPRSSSSTTRVSSRLAKSTVSRTSASALNGKLTPSGTPSGTPRPEVVSPINSEGGTPKCGTPRTLKSPVSLGLTPDLKNVRSKVGSTHNIKHKPGGGAVKIVSHKVDFSHVSSKCGSTDNIKHKPGGGVVKIESKKLDFSTVGSKVGSKDNIKHRPTSSSKKIVTEQLQWNAASKIGSLENYDHKPGGGNKKIDILKLDFVEKAQSKVGSLDNVTHAPGGGDKKIETVKLDFKEKARSKVGSLDNVKHQAGGGDVQILNQKLDFKEKARAKIGSLDTMGSREDGSLSPGVGNSEDSRSVTSQDTDHGQNEELLCEEKSVNSVTATS